MKLYRRFHLKSTDKGILLIGCLAMFLASFSDSEYLKLSYPQSWPKPVYDFEKKPLKKSAIELGRHLFYDPILSRDSTISCASCHLSFTAFTHVDHKLSHGIHDSVGTRNSPALVNLAWNRFFMWDGAINHIEVQALAPITHPAEMGEELNVVLEKINRQQKYRAMVQQAFDKDSVSSKELLMAIAQFQLTFISSNSKYDLVQNGKDNFTEQEQNGYELFKANCNVCHKEPLFTTGEFANNGLSMDSVLQDPGRWMVSKRPEDSLKFKIPTLRNIEFSYPYMHDGRFASLYEVLNHYEAGIEHTSTLPIQLRNGIKLKPNEKVDMVAFLLTLTDKSFLFNTDYSFPRN